MPKRNKFLLQNASSCRLVLSVEPEGVLFPLDSGEEVFIQDIFMKEPVTLKVEDSNKDETTISIWPGDGEVTIRNREDSESAHDA